MRKLIFALALTLPAAFALSACGPTDGAGPSNAVATANQSATTRPSAVPVPPASASPDAATAATPPPDHAHDTGASNATRRITVDEARAAFERKQVVFVDVRGEDAYRAGHIAGAVSIPTGSEAQHLDKLPKDKLIITYCA